MAPTTPIGVPSELVCGDTLQFYVPSYGDYPISEGWTPTYSFVGAGVLQTQSSELTNDGATWTCLVPAARTITLDSKEGAYQWYLFFTGSGAHAGKRYRADEGRITVKADPSNALDGDFQAQCEKDLAVVEAKIADRLTDDLKAYTIRGRQVVLMEPSELFAERSRLKREVWRLKNPGKAMPVLKFGPYVAI
jgi:hypothetical protein